MDIYRLGLTYLCETLITMVELGQREAAAAIADKLSELAAMFSSFGDGASMEELNNLILGFVRDSQAKGN